MEKCTGVEYEASCQVDVLGQLEFESHLPAASFRMQPVVSILSGPVFECKVVVSGSTVVIEGMSKENLGGVSESIGSSCKDLLAKLLRIKPASITLVNRSIFDAETSSQTIEQSFSLPLHVAAQLSAPELQSALKIFVQLIGPTSVTDNEPTDIDPDRMRSIVDAADNFRRVSSGKVLPVGMAICSPLWQEDIRLPDVLGEAPTSLRNESTKEATGAFRGYFIEGREAFFLENCKLGRKPLKVCFDEEMFFERIKKLSSRDFTICTIRYVEHLIGNKVDHLQLVDVTGVHHDFFEEGR